MNTYRKLPGLVNAESVPDINEQATRAELEIIAGWCGGTIQTFIEDKQAKALIKIPTLEGPLLAFAGDFIVKDGERITVEDPETFASQYVAAE